MIVQIVVLADICLWLLPSTPLLLSLCLCLPVALCKLELHDSPGNKSTRLPDTIGFDLSGAQKTCNISETIGLRLLCRTNRKLHTRFRLVPKSITLDDLERPKRHSYTMQTFYGANQKNFNEDRPIL